MSTTIGISIENPYMGFTIFQLNPCTQDQVKTIQDLEEERNDGVILLSRSMFSEVGKPMDVMVKPGLKEEFIVKLTARGLSPRVIGRICSDSKCNS